MRVILAGGGTAGHINPALAIADTIAQKDKNAEILFVGTKRGLESTLVPKKNYKIEYIDVRGMKTHLSFDNVVAAVKYVTAIGKSKSMIRKFKPDVVIGTGGYVCAPVVTAANSLKIPTVIHEQNVFPGNAIKMLSRKSTVTAISFAESTRYLENANEILLTGNPLRPEILRADRVSARAELGLKDEKFIVVFGGSLGAKAINSVVCDYIEKYGNANGIRMCVATGKYGYEDVTARIDAEKYPNVEIKQYIHNMDKILSAADLVVCRSGAITVSEICALGVPSILVPSPNVTRNHQEYNARALSDDGAAITILEKDFNADSLKSAVYSIINDTIASDAMRAKARSMGKLNAADMIYDKICKIIHK